MGNPTPSWWGDRRTSSERGYTWRWHKARTAFLRENPLCVMCRAEGRTTEAQVVDHIVPHRGDEKLFWDRSNWQSLCKPHHNSDKQMLEKSGETRTRFSDDGRVIW